jgi:hypothetical protein
MGAGGRAVGRKGDTKIELACNARGAVALRTDSCVPDDDVLEQIGVAHDLDSAASLDYRDYYATTAAIPNRLARHFDA